MANSSEELASQAQELESTISFFKVGNDQAKTVHKKIAKKPKSIKQPQDSKGYSLQFDGAEQKDEEFEAF